MDHETTVASGRAVLATRVIGRGRPVMFLHANVCDRRMWDAQVRAVGAVARAVAYDRRGFGRTRHEAEAHSPVADLMAVLDAVASDEPAILVGCSMGGKIALDAALRHPGRVAGLVLVAPGVGGAPAPAHPPAIAALLVRQAAAEAAGDLDALATLKARLWLDGPLAPEGRVTGEARRLFAEMIGPVLRAPPVGTSLDTAPAHGRLGEIRVPALVLYGTLDFPHIQARCRAMAAEMPDATAHELPGVAHLPSLERPESITTSLLAFLAHPSSGPASSSGEAPA